MENIQQGFIVKDHSVSGEEFELKYDIDLKLMKTFPQPLEDNLSTYYNSEEYISHTDSKRNLLEKAYHFVRAIALKRKVRLIESFDLDANNLLDVGCGTGDFLQAAYNSNWHVYGIEPNEKARSIANHKTNNAVSDIEQLNKFKDNSFDVITLWHVLEHLPKLEMHIYILKRLLKPNGRIVIAVPNYKAYDAAYYKSFWAAYDVPRHLWHFTKDSIKILSAQFDLKVDKILPMKFDAFYVSLLSEKYKNGKMNYFKSFWIGLKSNIKAIRTGEYSSLIYIVKNA